MTEGLYSRFERSFEAFADRPLVIDAQRTWTYADIARRAALLSARLCALGVEPGDRVLVQTDKSVDTLVLYIACVRAGAIYLPLNVDYTPAELAYFARDAGPVLAVCRTDDTALFEDLGQDGMQVVTLDLLMDELPEDLVPPAARTPDDIAAIVYTSGTTGKPKGAMLSNANLVSNGDTLVDLWRFTPEDRLIHALPLFHVHGLFVAVHCVLFSGASMALLPRFESGAVVAHMADSSVLMGVPTFYTRLLADPAFTQEAARSMRLFISGSAPLSADIHRAFEARSGHRVLERYGMTETGMLCSNPYEGERRAGFVGPPLPGVDLRIADAETGAPCKTGEVGSVEVRGPNVFGGYWQIPEKTDSAFRSDGYFITGDMGLIDAGGYVQLVGREKDLVISGGLNVYPAEVEAVLDDRPDIAEAAVIGVPHDDFGEAVVAVVAPAGRFDADAALAEMRAVLAAFKLPKRIVTVDELPRNTMGKIQKNVLRDRYRDLFSGR